MQKPLAIDFDPMTGYVLLSVAKPEIPVRVYEEAVKRGLIEKHEFHIGLVASHNAPALARALAVGKEPERLTDEVKALVDSFAFDYELTDEYYFLEKFYDQKTLGSFGYVGVPEHTRRAIAVRVDMKDTALFYERLEALLGHPFAAPLPHISLFAWSDYAPMMTRGISLGSEEDFKKYAKEKI